MIANCKCGHSRENHSVRGGFPFCEGTTRAACDCKGYEPEPPAKHTPGPWNVATHFNGRVTIQTHGFRPIAHVAIRKSDEASCYANARLIAAAPDLLEALKELVNMSTEFESVDSQKIGFLDCRNRLRASVERSLAAIARAEGGQL